jgi:hypothetical protein
MNQVLNPILLAQMGVQGIEQALQKRPPHRLQIQVLHWQCFEQLPHGVQDASHKLLAKISKGFVNRRLLCIWVIQDVSQNCGVLDCIVVFGLMLHLQCDEVINCIHQHLLGSNVIPISWQKG